MKKLICSQCHIQQKETLFSWRNKNLLVKHKICKGCVRKDTALHYQSNKKRYTERAKVWVENNKDKRKVIAKERYAEYRGYEPCKCCTRQQIQNFYSNCPENYHVDHIITLSKKGMHCLNNLQYLSASAHGTKSCNERWGNE